MEPLVEIPLSVIRELLGFREGTESHIRALEELKLAIRTQTGEEL